MKKIVSYALLKAFVISVGFSFICFIYGLVSGNPYEISLVTEAIFFLILFFFELLECLWKSRKKK